MGAYLLCYPVSLDLLRLVVVQALLPPATFYLITFTAVRPRTTLFLSHADPLPRWLDSLAAMSQCGD